MANESTKHSEMNHTHTIFDCILGKEEWKEETEDEFEIHTQTHTEASSEIENMLNNNIMFT